MAKSLTMKSAKSTKSIKFCPTHVPGYPDYFSVKTHLDSRVRGNDESRESRSNFTLDGRSFGLEHLVAR